MKVVNTFLVKDYMGNVNPLYECQDVFGNMRYYMPEIPNQGNPRLLEINKWDAENLINVSNF